MLGAVDLHGPVDREGRAGRGRADESLRPVRSGDEAHRAGQRAHRSVAFHPQEAPGRVTDRDDDARIGATVARKEERADHVHRAGERVRTAVGLEFFVRELERRQVFGPDESGARASPRLPDQSPDLIDARIERVPTDELLVRAFDQQAGRLG